MRSCIFNCYGDHYNETYYNRKHEVVVICDDDLYDHVPLDGGTYTVKSASLTGYADKGDLLDAVILAFSMNADGDGGYTPLHINDKNVINSNLKINPLWDEFFGALGGGYTDTWVLDEIVSFSSGQNNTGITSGCLDMPGNWYSEGFTFETGYFNHPGLGGSLGTMQAYSDPTHTDHFKYSFYVFPEAMIQDGIYQPTAMKPSTDDPDNPDRRLYCVCTLEAWRYVSGDLTGRYNFTISLRGKNANCAVINYLHSNDIPVGPIKNTKSPAGGGQDGNNDGGNGDNDNTSTNIPIPELPTDDLTDVGSVRIFAPSRAQLTQFMSYLHGATLPEAVLKMWQNPIQGIISLHYLPYSPVVISEADVDFMGVTTGVRMYTSKQFQSINFGSCYIGTDQNTYLDRSPYTKISLYLPGIGIRPLDTDDVMGKTIWVTYHCDNVSGQCVAFVEVGTSTNNRSVKYCYCGSLAAPFPISQENWGQTYVAAATLAASALAGGITAAGAAAAGKGGAAAGSGGLAALQATGTAFKTVADIGNSLSSLTKPSISRSGTISGTTSLFTVKKPYVIIERPNVVPYSDFNKIKGYACGKTMNMGNLKGYTEVESIHLTGIPATKPELDELEALLKGGVIL